MRNYSVDTVVSCFTLLSLSFMRNIVGEKERYMDDTKLL